MLIIKVNLLEKEVVVLKGIGGGNTAIAESAPKSWADAVVDLIDTIFQKVRYRGQGSIEFKMRPGTDEPVIMEPAVGMLSLRQG